MTVMMLFAGRRLLGTVSGRLLRWAALLARWRTLALAAALLGDVTGAAVARFAASLNGERFRGGFGPVGGEGVAIPHL